MIKTIVIDSTARNGGVTLLPKGLALGKITATGKYKEYDDSDGDGTGVFRGFLNEEKELAYNGVAADVQAEMVVWGRVITNNVTWDDSNEAAAAKTDASTGANGCFFIWD